MIKDGASIVDIGGESTRPGSKILMKILNGKEYKVVKNLEKKYKKTCLSIDTRKSSIMLKSLLWSGFN